MSPCFEVIVSVSILSVDVANDSVQIYHSILLFSVSIFQCVESPSSSRISSVFCGWWLVVGVCLFGGSLFDSELVSHFQNEKY